MGVKERRALEKELRRNQILDAARKLLFETGMKAISINKIAQEAELGVGTIYFYYKNKEEIFAALQEEGLKLLYAKIENIYQNKKKPDKKLKEMGTAYLQFSEDRKDYFDIISYFLSSSEVIFPLNLKTQIDLSGNKILSLISSTIDDGIKAGIFKAVNSRRFSIMFWGTVHGLVQFKKLKNTILNGENHNEIYQYSIDSLIDGLYSK
ncbi:MAG: TetR/AcrR family transcriptional regulator [Deltaproteobacteria bacterium]|nr:TetR/AcrR family transcriptional regulator [Deltaproteobacteria bacterium]MBW2219286.1 TetR/AcrR family transcriptional regulator [Deltaproteobacteria bacterium]